jgi:hypothetical protein
MRRRYGWPVLRLHVPALMSLLAAGEQLRLFDEAMAG